MTIPAELRGRYGIEGARLVVVEAGEGVLFKPALTAADLAGSGSAYATPEEMEGLLDRLGEEDL